jgi:hypothetical protein
MTNTEVPSSDPKIGGEFTVLFHRALTASKILLNKGSIPVCLRPSRWPPSVAVVFVIVGLFCCVEDRLRRACTRFECTVHGRGPIDGAMLPCPIDTVAKVLAERSAHFDGCTRRQVGVRAPRMLVSFPPCDDV